MAKSQGAKNRVYGHNAERYYVHVFKELGFSFCITARLGSRLHDNAKIDLINLPFNLQIKAGVQSGLNPGKELFSMESAIKAFFPPDDNIHQKPCFLVHKKPIGPGRKGTPVHEIVYMSNKQYQEYLKIVPNIELVFEKVFKFELNSEFKHIVGMTFEVFKENIIRKIIINGTNNNPSSTN